MGAVLAIPAIVLFAACGVYLSWRGRQKVERTLRESFARRTFQTAEGQVSGAALQVVKISRQTSRYAGDDVYRLVRDPVPNDAFWYCVGPGRTYFLAIAIVQAGNGKVSAEWIVRPLSEQAMRGALTGDRKAQALAFGTAIEG
ncbi:hypothetical protein JR065_10520 [Xanthomonas sp. AmX2]|uniref:hypothetical protein n=1 Tax=Xanthomonas sp. TaxID=29446 RepID=UPI00197F1E70|nr:hypothetical protein [Xanthomonas sp.]MBN6150776.1 hypothetical protein [Xanthomonas sp.]